ncbi:MAG TPA: hypothetical protein VJK48_04615, partial [Chlamydiales bacterium]|nr:hypothetical protein [Chlamydiales bacterium]
ARLLLETHRKTGAFLTDLSEETSEKINTFKYQILDHLKNQNLPHDPNDLLIQCLIHYAPPILQNRFLNTLLKIPDLHQKAIIGCYIASRLVYGKGLSWTPNIIDLLPTLKMSDLDS